MEKRKLVVNYKNLTPELIDLVKQKYPNGFLNHVIKVTKPNSEFFHAITLDTEDASYLIKVNVKIDTKPKDDDDEKGFFSDSDDIGTDEDTFPDDVEDQVDDEYGDD
ncbi:MAG TPA: hypothetical protein PL017_04120 [Tenuifilaceae bacterium]|nr:hypothetical protein [Tenuifilaceae bacterium]HPE18268.1 hypothetical protein [Tenuifilaceae bacterium]HPJ45261.1 hypothetical protein [Tenuifilaceae bacterium]HPQ33382.1 hypothetical protein [Tenuifilaceae bacterium]HRX67533.1 hypothetical protein [Tenuifilaceae bacterium]